MAQVEISAKTVMDWAFRILALSAPLAFGWAWDTGRDMALMQQAQKMNEAAVVQKLSDLKEDYEDKIEAIETANAKEIEHLKGQMQKVESIGNQADQNAMKLVEIGVKMDQARNTLDEIKKLVAER